MFIFNNAIEEPHFGFQRSIQSNFHIQGSAAKKHSSMASISTFYFLQVKDNFYVFHIGLWQLDR